MVGEVVSGTGVAIFMATVFIPIFYFVTFSIFDESSIFSSVSSRHFLPLPG